MQVICYYDNFKICECNNCFFVFEEGEPVKRVTLVKEIKAGDYENMDILDLLQMCEDYDYSGELDDCLSYCFWKVNEIQELQVSCSKANTY